METVCELTQPVQVVFSTQHREYMFRDDLEKLLQAEKIQKIQDNKDAVHNHSLTYFSQNDIEESADRIKGQNQQVLQLQVPQES